MTIQTNPLYSAYQTAVDSGQYTDEELKEMLEKLTGEGTVPEKTREMRDLEGTKPVTTLNTIEDEGFSLEAPGGPIQTTKQREAAKEFAKMAAQRSESKE